MKKINKILTLALFLILFLGTTNCAKSGTNDVSDKNPVIFQSYMRDMQRKIKANWNPPENEQSARVVVSYKISKSGKVSSVKVIESSGNKAMDNSAIDAVKKASPLGKFPAESDEKSVDVNFTFDYNVHKNK